MMQRISVPGRAPEFIDLGTGTASSGEIRGTIATPLPTRGIRDDVDAEARRIRNNAVMRAWREANRERVREYDRLRKRRAKAGVS